MNRTIWIVAAALSAPSLWLLDSALKGAALLVLAAAAATVLRRDSAATRHLVWFLAIVALLAVPALSAMLPRWRVLPQWAGMPTQTVAAVANPPASQAPAGSAVQFPEPGGAELPTVVAHEPAAASPPAASAADSRPAATGQPAAAAPIIDNWNWLSALPLVWAIGFGVLSLRLLAARWLLWRTEQQTTILGEARWSAPESRDAIAVALEAACSRLAMRRPVTLLIHADKTIPVVWGVWRPRLMLPAAARHWSDEQLQSVLLHELAHIQRHDTLALLLTQIACALHWFNPLVWVASWRLGVERERACDDLVLASGVRPSAYAGHLLEVVTQLSPARWTQSCGLAMARSSSLEGRLVAVLNGSQSRRRVSVALAGIALALAASIAVPIAMLRAQEETKAAEERTGAPMPQQPAKEQPQKPSAGTQLKSVTEQKLKWGEPTNGLRMALAWPPTLGEPGMGDAPEFYLVVQNVSDAAVRLTANDAAPNPRRLMMRDKGSPLQGLRDTTPMPGDWLLQPREVAFVRLFQKEKDGHITSAVIEDNIRAFPHYSMTAEMTIEKAPEGAWTGKLSTGQTRGSVDVIPPKHKGAQALYESWMTAARADGKIPGGVIARLGQSVATFIKNNPTWETTPQLQKMLPRFDGSRDWIAQDAVALLDELAALQDTPIDMALDRDGESPLRSGAALPRELAAAPWGEALPNGLRMAWLLEPRGAEHRLNTPLKSRILIHNAGQKDVAFRTRTWHQSGAHQARDAKGAEIKIDSTYWTTRGRLVPYRLAPGEFVELIAAGIGVGANQNSEDWQNTRVGSWIEAQAGDDVTFTPDAVPLSDWNDEPRAGDEAGWWLDHIKSRLARHQPFPADAAARKLLLYRIAMELFGTPVSDEINAAFVADTGPGALDALAKRLADREGLTSYAGSLQSGPTKFRVLPADPDAAKRPRTASNPGRYTLGDTVRLIVTRRPDGERIVNEAAIHFYSTDPKAEPPGKPVALALPDGYNTWSAAWLRGGTVLWVQQKSGIRRYDFTNPVEVKDEAVEPDQMPADIREALRAAIPKEEAPQPAKEAPPPAAEAPAAKPPAVKPPDDALWKTKMPFEKIPVAITNWSAAQEGLRIGMHVVADEGWRAGGKVKIELWLHNSGSTSLSFNANPGRADVGLAVAAKDSTGEDHFAESGIVLIIAIPLTCTLPAGHVAKVKDFELSFDAPDNQELAWFAPKFRNLEPGKYKLRCVWADAHPSVSAASDWTGELVTGEVEFTLAAAP